MGKGHDEQQAAERADAGVDRRGGNAFGPAPRAGSAAPQSPMLMMQSRGRAVQERMSFHRFRSST